MTAFLFSLGSASPWLIRYELTLDVHAFSSSAFNSLLNRFRLLGSLLSILKGGPRPVFCALAPASPVLLCSVLGVPPLGAQPGSLILPSSHFWLETPKQPRHFVKIQLNVESSTFCMCFEEGNETRPW